MDSEQRTAPSVLQANGAAVGSAERGTEIAQFFLLARRYRKLIAAVASVGTVAAAIVAFLLPNEYASTVNAVPPKRPQTGMESVLGGISSALRDIGLMRVTPGRAAAMGYDFMVVLQSRSLLDSLIDRFDLITVYEITDAKSLDSARSMAREELMDRYEVELDGAGNYRITVIDRDRYRAAAMANAVVEIANNIARDLDRRENEVLLQGIQQRIDAMLARMNVVADSLSLVSRKTLMFAPLEQAQAAASAIAETKAQLLSQEIILTVLEQRYGNEDPATEQQRRVVESLRQKVNQLEQRPGFVGNFSLKDAPKAAYDYMRYYTELETMMRLKAAMAPTLEDIRSSLTRYSPSLYVVDAAIPAVKKERPRRLLIIGGALVSSAILGFIIAMLLDQWRTIRARLDGMGDASAS
ncbi:MAG: Wzz/FepE/Etk N-terminal domain-containing protein [Bacteroidota bacterium]|nr:Wzz/FepE/Etk N-terminal domain-containing protein [Candidatus Kapabacteria bacterium]MCS7302370.1 Wzz/FepE/Etk N-terminal domain-containing protein [Candidatus Kapabacteria bacterium]MDW8271948.1 Wzz/FepE/Etk N-terminal domain-containing protein [Bacteroidota bacterium]